MKRAFLAIAASALALSGAMAVQADVSPLAAVQDSVLQGETMPRYLAEFGFFIDEGARQPAGGVISYELNTPLYSDGAEKLRYIYVPEGARVGADGEGLLQFPVGSAIIKTFAFGQGTDLRYIETRVLLHRADGWLALPYLWNEEQTEARLAIAGARLPITTPRGEEISYRVPNKNQCKECHSNHGEVIPIGPKARNLSRDWLTDMAAIGALEAVPSDADILPAWGDHAASLPPEPFARAYLDVNCAHCHQPGGMASNSGLDLRWEQDQPSAYGVRKKPVAAGRGAGGFLVSIEPGAPERSIIVHRMNSTEPGVAMPELGRATVDHDGVAVVERWIAEMVME